MGSTINGVYTGKRGRRKRALERLERNLKVVEVNTDRYFEKLENTKTDDKHYDIIRRNFLNSSDNLKRINKEIAVLKTRI